MHQQNKLAEKTEFTKLAREIWAKQLRKPSDEFEQECQEILREWEKKSTYALTVEEIDHIWNEAKKIEQAKYKNEKTGEKDDDSMVIERNLLELRCAIEKSDIRPAFDTFSRNAYVHVANNQIQGVETGVHFLDDDLIQAIRIDAIAQNFFFQARKGFQAAQFSARNVEDALRNMAVKNKFNLIEQHLDELKKEYPEPDVDYQDALIEAFGLEDTDFNRWVGRYLYLGMIERVINPGCQMDYCVILKGSGGIGKSTFIKNLLPEHMQEYVNTNFQIQDNTRSMYMSLEKRMVCEFGELHGLNRAQMENVKTIITNRVDTWDRKNVKYTEQVPRSCIIIGTTDKHLPLNDDDNKNRRFIIVESPLPLSGNDVGIKWMKDQERISRYLVAAYLDYLGGARAYVGYEMYKDEILMKNEENAYIDEEVDGRIREYLKTYKFEGDEGKKGVKMHKLVDHLVDESPVMGRKMKTNQLGPHLRRLGFERRHYRKNGNAWIFPLDFFEDRSKTSENFQGTQLFE